MTARGAVPSAVELHGTEAAELAVQGCTFGRSSHLGSKTAIR